MLFCRFWPGIFVLFIDSLTIAISEDSLLDVARNKHDFNRAKSRFLETESTKGKFGLMKLESTASRMYAPSVKVYYQCSTDCDLPPKTACKGIRLRRNREYITEAAFYSAVFDGVKGPIGINSGFKISRNECMQFEQKRSMISGVYSKRYVCDDMINTLCLDTVSSEKNTKVR